MRHAFTMLELIFVIVLIGILSKFGVELFLQTYEGYARSMYINDLQSKSEAAVKTLANRLSHRIKDSITSADIGANAVSWRGLDVENWQDGSWSGIIDLASSNSTVLSSPGTAALGAAEIFFVGSNIGTDQNTYHSVTLNTDQITGNFAGQEVYEYYQVIDGEHNITQSGDEILLDGNLLTDEAVAAPNGFKIEKLGDGLHIRICLEKANNTLLEGQVCKEKYVF